MRTATIAFLLVAVAVASADDEAPARYYFVNQWPAQGTPIPSKEIEIAGTPKARQMFGNKPICVPYSPTNQLTLTLTFKRPRLVTGFRFRDTAGASYEVAKAHGRIRELTVETAVGVVRGEVSDEMWTPPEPDTPDCDSLARIDPRKGKYTGQHSFQFGFAPLLTYKQLEPAPTQTVTVTVSLYWVGDKVQDVCLSNLEVLELPSP